MEFYRIRKVLEGLFVSRGMFFLGIYEGCCVKRMSRDRNEIDVNI